MFLIVLALILWMYPQATNNQDSTVPDPQVVQQGSDIGG